MKILILLAVVFIMYTAQRKLYSKYWDSRLNINVNFQKKPVSEGEKAFLTEVIENRKRLPLIYLSVKFQISRFLLFDNAENTSTSDFNYKSDVFSILSHQRITRKLYFKCSKRGYYEIDKTDIISSDLLGTKNLAHIYPQNSHLYVYPRPIDISSLDIEFKKMIGTATAKAFLYEDPFEFRGIRDYSRTDPMNSINWNASARTGELMVNLHDSTSSRQAVIILNLETETIWKYDQLHEIAIRLSSAICSYFLNASIPTRMICNGRDCFTDKIAVIPPGTGPIQLNSINEVLARIDLTRKIDYCAKQIDTLMLTPNYNDTMYILISNAMNTELINAYQNLTKHSAASMWIVPLYDDMELKVSSCKNMEVVRWRVDKYED